MRVPHRDLITFVPELAGLAPERIAGELNRLGLETELLAGEQPVYELKVTPNRGDALSVLGVARDLQAKLDADAPADAIRPVLRLIDQAQIDRLDELSQPTITVETDDCTQYHAVLLDNVAVQPSPPWLADALVSFGLRPINNVVDMTNYLMELYGQPLHAFDADAIVGGTITIRHAHDGEALTTFDGTERTPGTDALVAADAKAVVDLAGIQGGANTAVSNRTTRILLQSALFKPAAIRASMRAAKHGTDASYRYARGVDPTLSLPVLHQAVELLSKPEFGHAKAIGKLIIRTAPADKLSINVDDKRVRSLIGATITRAAQQRLLERLGCQIGDTPDTPFAVTPPPWRSDLTIWQDCAEEIARLTGLDTGIDAARLPATKPHEGAVSDTVWVEGLKDCLVELGFSEVLTYSFIGKQDLDRFALPDTGELANPLNPQLRFLRPSLLPGLAGAVGKNGYYDPILLFEIGHVFTKTSEHLQLGLAIANQKEPLETWTARIADTLGLDSSELTAALHNVAVGNEAAQQYRIRNLPAYLAEIPIKTLKTARRIPATFALPGMPRQYRPISKFPPVTRDLSLLVPTETPPETVRAYLVASHPFVEDVTLFDEFVSPKLGEGKKSLSFHILFSSPERTLELTEIEQIEHRMAHVLEREFGATIR